MDVEAQIRLWVIKSCDMKPENGGMTVISCLPQSKLPTVTFPSILAPNKIHENCISGGLRFGVQKIISSGSMRLGPPRSSAALPDLALSRLQWLLRVFGTRHN